MIRGISTTNETGARDTGGRMLILTLARGAQPNVAGHLTNLHGERLRAATRL